MHLQVRDHVLLDDEVRLVEVLDDVIVVLAVDVDDDGLDGRLALDEDTCTGFSTAHMFFFFLAEWAYLEWRAAWRL